MNDGREVVGALFARVAPGLHGPAAVVSLRGEQERDPSLKLGPAALAAGVAQEIEGLAGGVSVVGGLPELAPAAILVLTLQKQTGPCIDFGRRLTFAHIAEQTVGEGLR